MSGLLAGVQTRRAHAVRDRTAHLDRTDTRGGSPVRFRSGAVAISPDQQWQTELAPLHRLLVDVPSAPLLRRYAHQAGSRPRPQLGR